MASNIASHSDDRKPTARRDGREEQPMFELMVCLNKCVKITSLEDGSPQLFAESKSLENSSRSYKRKIPTLKHEGDKQSKKRQKVSNSKYGSQQVFAESKILGNISHPLRHEISMSKGENGKQSLFESAVYPSTSIEPISFDVENQAQFDITKLFERNLHHIFEQILSNLKDEADRLSAAKALWPILEKVQLLKLLGLSEPLESDPCYAELYRVRRNRYGSLATSTSEPNDTQLSYLHDQSYLCRQSLIDLITLKYNWKKGTYQEQKFKIQEPEHTSFIGYSSLVLFSHRYIVVAFASIGRLDKMGRSKCHTSIALYDVHDCKKINEISVPRPFDGEISRLNTAMSGNVIVFSAVSTVVLWELDTFRVRMMDCLRPGRQLMKLLKNPIFFTKTDNIYRNTGADVFCDSNILVNCVNMAHCHKLAVYNISGQQENLLLEEQREMFIRRIETGPAYYFLLLQWGASFHLQLRSKDNFSLNMTIDLSPRDDLTISYEETSNSCFVQEFFISCPKLEVRCIQHRKLLHRFTSRGEFPEHCLITIAFDRLFALDKSRLTYWNLGNDLVESWRKTCSSGHSTIASTSSAIAQLVVPEHIVSFREIKLHHLYIGWYEKEDLKGRNVKSRIHSNFMHIAKASFIDALDK